MSILTHRAVKSVIPTGQSGAIPPLDNGDRLTRAEFMRLYDAMPDLKKAELIEGVGKGSVRPSTRNSWPDCRRVPLIPRLDALAGSRHIESADSV